MKFVCGRPLSPEPGAAGAGNVPEGFVFVALFREFPVLMAFLAALLYLPDQAHSADWSELCRVDFFFPRKVVDILEDIKRFCLDCEASRVWFSWFDELESMLSMDFPRFDVSAGRKE